MWVVYSVKLISFLHIHVFLRWKRFVEKSICKAFNFLKYLNLILKITIVIVTESYP